MYAICGRCQRTFTAPGPGRQRCPSCGQEVWLPGAGDAPPAASPAYVGAPGLMPGAAPLGPPVGPGRLPWLKTYYLAMGALDLGAIFFGIAGGLGAFVDGGPKPDDVMVGIFIVLAGLAMLAGHLGGLFFPRTKTGYTLHMVVLGVSTLACCWPAALALLIGMTRPEARRWWDVTG